LRQVHPPVKPAGVGVAIVGSQEAALRADGDGIGAAKRFAALSYERSQFHIQVPVLLILALATFSARGGAGLPRRQGVGKREYTMFHCPERGLNGKSVGAGIVGTPKKKKNKTTHRF